MLAHWKKKELLKMVKVTGFSLAWQELLLFKVVTSLDRPLPHPSVTCHTDGTQGELDERQKSSPFYPLLHSKVWTLP